MVDDNLDINNNYINNINIKIEPKFGQIYKGKLNFFGFIGERLKVNEKEWLLKAVATNPAMVEIFNMRDRRPNLNLDTWSGIYPGQFLIGAVLCWRISKSFNLKTVIQNLVKDLADVQDSDGYLGPFAREKRFFGTIKKYQDSSWYTGPLSASKKLWETPLYEEYIADLWGHYHCMLGLFLWYKETKNKVALDTCLKSAKLILDKFLNSDHRVYDTGFYPFNMAIIHVFCLLYKEFGDIRYLKMAKEIEYDWQKQNAGNYLKAALEGKEFYEMRAPRWESLHNIQALYELYLVTGDVSYRKAFEHIYWSIKKYDRHNTGGFSSDEQAKGNPYDLGIIETCAVIAWITLSVDMLCLTGLSIIADEIELSTFNSLLGAQSPSGRWWTYNTPMNGYRKSFYHDINWQCLPGGPELNCCYTKSATGLGLLSCWAIMLFSKGIIINYYGPVIFAVTLPSGRPVKIIQETDYPKSGNIILNIELKEAEKFVLKLRIPQWSENTFVSINDKEEMKVKSGDYLCLNREWKNGDTIKLILNMSLHFWIGEKECSGKTSIYYGPILLAYDQRFNRNLSDDIPMLDGCKPIGVPVSWEREPKPWVLLKFKINDGHDLILCDFASAGATGTNYKTWMAIKNIPDHRYFGYTRK